MNRTAGISRAVGLVVLLSGCTASGAAERRPAGAPIRKGRRGPHAVVEVTRTWHDAARNRDVPARIYLPKSGKGPFPVIVFSHGLGGSRDGYRYLGEHWAGHGYVSVHLQHKGSDDAVWRGKLFPLRAMRRAAADPRNAIHRPLDVRFAVDRLTEMNRADPRFKGRLDLDRLGIAGHSFGAWTTLVVAGQVLIGPTGRTFTFPDPRFKAAIAMSAPAPRRKEHHEKAYGRIRIPCLHMTGTLDDGLIAHTKAADRRVPFDCCNGSDQYLVTFRDGDHMIFSGRRFSFRARHRKDAVFQDLIRRSSTAFWDAYLRGDPKAKQWLAGGGFRAVLGENGTFEVKLKKPAAGPDSRR